ncbi:unnamed protein product [Mycena citricolor]|uniref:Uncharacterized protein n=1 Tax=Mycena citricolor TaxID=2018698 RepID=A0AAD2GVT1_9AGAR|nr:unnamed protein product [Mycena citricolor]
MSSAILNLKFKGHKSFVPFSNVDDAESLTKMWKVTDTAEAGVTNEYRAATKSGLMSATEDLRPSPAHTAALLQFGDVYTREMGYSLIESPGLFAGGPTLGSTRTKLYPDAWPVTITMASIAMLQIALFNLLSSGGVRPAPT